MGFTNETEKKQHGMMNHYGTRGGLCMSMLNFNAFLETERDKTREEKEEQRMREAEIKAVKKRVRRKREATIGRRKENRK
jgi:hypothetical protein